MSASSWYRRSLFNYKGNREFTRTGYEAASTRFVEGDLDVDCTDKQFMITGSNSGIGLQTALEVARKGGVIHMVCRNKEAATRARSEIITTTGNDKIHLHIVDLAKPREVIVWAQQFAAQHEKLDVLIHNAGCMVHERYVDQDGVECNFAVNTLAVHILTLTFMELLQRSEEPRVVIVSSGGLLTVRLDPVDLMHENLDPFNGALVYSQNKRQQVVMTLWYAQHYNKIHFSSMHPGWADTPAVRTSIPQFYEMMKDNLRSPAQGADTVVWLAISKAALKHPGGLFFQDREPVSTHFPLAWTKSSIEEEDILMNKIQEIYTRIFNKVGAAAVAAATAAAAGATTTATTVLSTPAPSSSEEKVAGTSEDKNESVEKVEGEEATKSHPLASNSDPGSFPVLPPPPPPAQKLVPAKTELVQEVAEIHAPPSSSHLETTPLQGNEEREDAEKDASVEGIVKPSSSAIEEDVIVIPDEGKETHDKETTQDTKMTSDEMTRDDKTTTNATDDEGKTTQDSEDDKAGADDDGDAIAHTIPEP